MAPPIKSRVVQAVVFLVVSLEIYIAANDELSRSFLFVMSRLSMKIKSLGPLEENESNGARVASMMSRCAEVLASLAHPVLIALPKGSGNELSGTVSGKKVH